MDCTSAVVQAAANREPTRAPPRREVSAAEGAGAMRFGIVHASDEKEMCSALGGSSSSQDASSFEKHATRSHSRVSSSFIANSSSRIMRSQKTVRNLLSLGEVEVRGENFKLEVSAVRRRLRSLSRRTLDPNARFLRFWDSVTSVGLCYTALFTPFEVAFMALEMRPQSLNFIANRLVDGIFACDVVVSFFVPYRASPMKGGMMVYDNRKIASN